MKWVEPRLSRGPCGEGEPKRGQDRVLMTNRALVAISFDSPSTSRGRWPLLPPKHGPAGLASSIGFERLDQMGATRDEVRNRRRGRLRGRAVAGRAALLVLVLGALGK